ncbi:MAG: HAD family hydrolase [Oscillospiraceae bacterium]|jgi:phosphoglycolate phosphatase|nr:HAD family hydrolase [Oscillospiraceae bacterium]
MKKTFHAVLFDLDGTLLNTIDDLADSMNAALEKYGYKRYTPDEYRYFVGRGAYLLTKQAAGEGAPEEDVARILQEYSRVYTGLRGGKTRPYDGIPAALEWLNARRIPVGVLSNKPHAHTTATVAQYFPGGAFLSVVGQRESVPIKPDPVGALEFAVAAGLDAGEIVFVGDTGVDMLTAKNAGMYGVGALWGFRTASELQKGGARELLARPLDVVGLFE